MITTATADPRTLAIVALIAVAPIAIVAIVALLRGYTITIHFTRRNGRNDH